MFVKNADYQSGLKLVTELGSLLETESLDEVKAELSGDVPLGCELVGSISGGHFQFLAIAFLGMMAILRLLYREWETVLWVMVCPILATTAVYAVMGYLNVPLGLAASMFAPMTIGIGVDYSVHLFHAGASTIAKQPNTETPFDAYVFQAVRSNAIVLMSGFSVLAFSSLRANATLGVLLVGGMEACYLLTKFVVMLYWTLQATYLE